MRSRRARWSFVLMLALSACAEGGSRGSGISTVLVGNVAGVQGAAPTSGSLASIRVKIEGTGIHRVTDASGAFTVRGDFEGMVSVLFVVPGAGNAARLISNVPANGQLTLTDVTVDTESGQAQASRQGIAFQATLVSIDCSAQVASVVSRTDQQVDQDQYLLRLDTSSVTDAQGHPVPCRALSAGDAASVQGRVNPDLSFGDATVVVGE